MRGLLLSSILAVVAGAGYLCYPGGWDNAIMRREIE
jgi:hypothetical protein